MLREDFWEGRGMIDNTIPIEDYLWKNLSTREKHKIIEDIPLKRQAELLGLDISQFLDKEEEKVGFKNDEIFLPSIEEYEKYKDVIPKIETLWWLRSPGCYSYGATSVNNDGSIYDDGDDVRYSIDAVRPMINLKICYKDIYDKMNIRVGTILTLYKFPWVIIDANKGIAIAEVPIFFSHFDSESNNYENSDIREALKKWKESRHV